MFSPLARGKAGWDGDLQCEEYSDQTSSIEPLLPQLLNHTTPRNKSARSNGSFLLEDGQLALPKTFVTRKGAIILFTPSEDLCHHGNGENHLTKENIYEAGLKLRTLGNLTNSVLEFGKEDEETWEGIPNYPNKTSGRENPQKRDNTFLRFLHYLDSENLTADKHVQPGADPDYYLEELKKSSGHNSHRRFRSQTAFSTKTSYSTNTASHYSQFLEDDEEITGIVQDYMKYGRSGRSENKEHLEHRVISSDHMPGIGVEGCETLEEFSSFSTPRSPRMQAGHTTFSSSIPSMASLGYGSIFYEAANSRPKTAPIPPTLASPRANPRITSDKPPPLPRALGSTPNHLYEIINADVGFGRYQRRGPSPRVRPSRSPSPSFHLGSSRGATPDGSKVQRLASPDGKSEEWNRTTNVIEEEDEAALPDDQMESGNNLRRPSSAGSLQSDREEKMNVQRRVSSAGTANRRTRSSLHSSRSASLSSVSYYNRGLSAMSRDRDYLVRSPEFDEMEREESSPTWPGVRDELLVMHDDDAKLQATWQVSGDIAGSEAASPSRDSAAKSPSPPPRSPSVASRVATPSTRSASVQSRREKVARSRGSSAVSSAASEQWKESIMAAGDAEERKSSSSSRERIIKSRSPDLQNDGQDEEIKVDGDIRTSSAKSSQEGTETKATLGSEADLAQVSEAIVRSQSVVEEVHEEMVAKEEKVDQEWPGVVEDGKDAELEEMSKSDDEESITQELAGSREEEFLPTQSLDAQDSSEPDSIQSATPPNTAEQDEVRHEIQQETPAEEVHRNEVVTSTASFSELHENETTLSVSEPREYEETVIVVPQPSPPVELVTAESAISDEVSTHVQDSGLSILVPENLSINAQEPMDSTLITPDEPARKATEIPRASSPSPIKADQILHKELLAQTGLKITGKVDDRRPTSPYKEMIDIEKSRPQSPVNEEQRSVPVSIGEAVRNYIESGQEPQVRDRSARSRRGSGTGFQEKEVDKKAAEKSSTSSMEGEPRIRPKPEAVKTTTNKQAKSGPSGLSEKPKAGKSKAESKPDLPGLGLVKNDEKNKEMKEPTIEEREARRQLVSDLLSKHDTPKESKLELEGIGKEGEEGESTSSGLVTRTSPTIAEKKNDLSDLAALISKNKTPSKPKDKKSDLIKKSGKPSKSAKKKNELESTIDPENIDFDAFNTPEMLDGMDDELRQFIQEQSKSDVTSTVVNQASDGAVDDEPVNRRESVHTMQMPQVAPEVSPEKRDAYAPSVPKKMSKKELAKLRADQRKEERKRKEAEKRLKEEEMRLLKQREEEAVRAKAEAEEKQKNIEEEKNKRMEEEEEAKRQEQEALEKLKEAKKKAREERESRRAAEAERRRLEVQKKREEKKKREEEIKEREKELEQQRMNREKKMAEIDEARRRKDELERLEEEQRREEERLLALQMEEEERRLEEEKIREAEEELQRIQEEREYREQMRRIAEMQEAKLKQEEEERLRREEEERQQAEEERRKRKEAEQERLREEQRRIEMARRLEALARMRSAQAATRRKALLLKRREENMERMQSLKNTRSGQHITRAFVFTYYTHIPRKVWEVPIGFNKKKKGFGSFRRKPAPPKPP